MKDIPIGEYFTIGNEVYKCVVDYTDSCKGCDISIGKCANYTCYHSDRIDGESVNFIRYDDTTEDDQQDD